MCGTWCFTGPNSKPPLARIPTSSARVSANLRGSDCTKPLASGHHFDSRYPRSEWSLRFQVKSFKLEVSRLQLGFGLILSHFPSWTKRCQWHCETLPASERPAKITSDEKWFVYSWQLQRMIHKTHKTTMLSTNCHRSPCHFSRLLGKASLTCSQLQLLATLAPAMWIHELLLFPWEWESDPAKSDQNHSIYSPSSWLCQFPGCQASKNSQRFVKNASAVTATAKPSSNGPLRYATGVVMKCDEILHGSNGCTVQFERTTLRFGISMALVSPTSTFCAVSPIKL